MFAKGAISWRSEKQDIVLHSTGEAEFIALSFAIRETLWHKKFSKPVEVFSDPFEIAIKADNQECISLSKDKLSMTDQSTLYKV